MAEISEITDSLVSRARAVAQQSDELIAAMDEAGRRVAGAAAPERSNDFAGDADAQQNPPGPQPPVDSPPPPEPRTRGRRRTRSCSLLSRRPCGPPPLLRHMSRPRPAGASSDRARLLAMQMAVAGSSKDEIAWRLREEFGIEDSSGILAQIGI